MSDLLVLLHFYSQQGIFAHMALMHILLDDRSMAAAVCVSRTVSLTLSEIKGYSAGGE